MTNEVPLGTTVLKGRRTPVPERVIELLELKATPRKKEKLLWTQEGDEVVVTRGTPQSSFKKTKLSINGTAAVPKHVREFLKLESTLGEVETVVWIRRGNQVVFRKGIGSESTNLQRA